MSNSPSTGLALDVGERRIGVARANLTVRMAHPLTTLSRPESFIDDVIALVKSEDAAWVVIGLPRGLQGQDTAQTAYAREFGAALETAFKASGITLPVYWTDEALTSVRAEEELQSRQRSGARQYGKGEVDALAATYILEDFLMEQRH